MTTLVVPPFETDEVKRWPTLGPQVCDLLEERAVYGPGSLRGQPYVVDDEMRAFINRAYQVHPRGTPRAGRRRFRRVALSLRKGSRKTEIGAALAFVELHPEGPVRCDGFDAAGRPVGRPVVDPYIPMVAYTEEQTEDLAYAALYVMCAEGADAGLFDIALERIRRRGGTGKAEALSAAPDARDGARTTFEHFDETHRFTLPRLVEGHGVMLENLLKRPDQDPWACSTSTAYQPGENSVAEREATYAKLVAKGKIANPSLFYFHREASPADDLNDREQRRAAVIEASGPVVVKWSDVDAISDRYDEPDVDRAYWERVWLNRATQTARVAFDVEQWRRGADPTAVIDPGEAITLGFDGARYRDATALVATHVRWRFQWPLGIWERPLDTAGDGWEVPADEVDAAVHDAFTRYRVLRMYGDPAPAMGWDLKLAEWAGRYGPKRVVLFHTDARELRKTARAVMSYAAAIRQGDVTHTGDEQLSQHIGNARKRLLRMLDENGQPLWVLEKERHDSPFKIDGAMAAVLSWRARLDVIAAGEPLHPDPVAMPAWDTSAAASDTADLMTAGF